MRPHRHRAAHTHQCIIYIAWYRYIKYIIYYNYKYILCVFTCTVFVVLHVEAESYLGRSVVLCMHMLHVHTRVYHIH